jgi:nicotinamide phosphoribosyltransferase
VNIILDTDSYKASHPAMYPKNMLGMECYLEAREEGGIRPAVKDITDLDYTVFFGLQGLCMDYLCDRLSRHSVDEAEDIFREHGVSFYRDGWDYIADKYGCLPIEINAVPEGAVVPRGNVLLRLRGTDDRVPWIASWVEDLIVRLWYPITVATISRRCKEVINHHLVLSSDNAERELPFKLHDFGARGVSSRESAAIGGAAHLVNFLGTDTIQGMLYAMNNYNCLKVPGLSIDAAEHNTIISWKQGKYVDWEAACYRNMVKLAKPGQVFAVVSDTEDIYNAVEHIWGETLRQDVIDSGATLVVRPDSGDPVEVVSATLAMLGEKFGYTVNNKGYRVLKHVRVIQGDGMELSTINELYGVIVAEGWSAENLAVGMGGGLLQKCNRDTLRFAYKACAIKVETPDGNIGGPVTLPVSKKPRTDLSKQSKSGDLDLILVDGKYRTIDRLTDRAFAWHRSELVPYFRNGNVIRQEDFSEIRKRAWRA